MIVSAQGGGENRRSDDEENESVRFFAAVTVAVVGSAVFWLAVGALVYLLLLR